LNTPIKAFSVRLGGATGISPYKVKAERRLSDMREHFSDRALAERMLQRDENPVIYEVYEVPQTPIGGQLNVGCTVVYPGTIGDEFYFTMGHFHQKETTSEVYVGMEGEGLILMQDRQGGSIHLDIKPGILVYIPPNTAHRTVNTARDTLIFLAVYPSDAGHDYESVRTKGFEKLIVQKNGKPSVIDNPNYRLR